MLETHHDYIRRSVPPERLFFFNVKDGWGPLCKILDCPIPDEPFPHANDSDAVQQEFWVLVKMAATRWMQIFALSGILMVMGFYACR
jgi:hypothetical protein